MMLTLYFFFRIKEFRYTELRFLSYSRGIEFSGWFKFLYLLDLQESISSISFSNKGSRYICSGGTGQVVRIWDLQRKRCIKWLRGHTDTITGAMYNCKDEHLASISLSGDVIIHNLASGARATELKDPNEQVFILLKLPTLLSSHFKIIISYCYLQFI